MKYLAIVLLFIPLLTGCVGESDVKPDVSEADQLEKIETLIADEDYVKAAQQFKRLAASSEEPDRSRHLVQTANMYALANWHMITETTLSQVDDLNLSADDKLLKQILLAESKLKQRQSSQVIELLAQEPDINTDPALRLRRHKRLADAYSLSGNLLEAAYALADADILEPDQEKRKQLQLSILRNLMPLGQPVLAMLQPNPPGIKGGWMSLALIAKQNSNNRLALADEFSRWKEQNPFHPVLPTLFDKSEEKAEQPRIEANNIAILLPETGRFEKAAEAIKNGIAAAWYADPIEPRPTIRYYDSTTEQQIWPAYTQAIEDGANIVIGPLQKSSVLQFARAGELPVPVLALNSVTTDVTGTQNLYQFALSPEDEARQVADRAWLDGKTQPAILYPGNKRGERIKQAFIERWHELGETISSEENYTSAKSDFSAPIRSLMLINQSAARNQKLQRALGTKLKFEPRIRADVDFIFLISGARQTREIKPQLAFHYAGDLPVYATSQAWNGKLTHQEAPDYSGIILPDIPWLLIKDETNPLGKELLKKQFPESDSPLGRLYAMGIDAYSLIKQLPILESDPQETMDGQTGNLYMDRERNIRRQLVWVELGKKVKISGYSPRLDLINTEGPVQYETLFEENSDI